MYIMSRTLNGLSDSGTLSLCLIKPYNLGDLPNVQQARTNLGLVGTLTGGNYITMTAFNATQNSVINLQATTSGEANKLLALDNSGNTITNSLNVSSKLIMGSNISTIFCNYFEAVQNSSGVKLDDTYTINFSNNKVGGITSLTCTNVACTNISGNGSGLTGFTASQIPSLDASKITTGTFTTSLIPQLDYNKCVSAGKLVTGSPTGWYVYNIASSQFIAGQNITFDTIVYAYPLSSYTTPFTIKATGIYNLSLRFQIDVITTGNITYNVMFKVNGTLLPGGYIQESYASTITEYRMNTLTCTYTSLSNNDVLQCYVQTATNCKIKGICFSANLISQSL